MEVLEKTSNEDDLELNEEANSQILFEDDGDIDISDMFAEGELEEVEMLEDTSSSIATKQDLYDGKMDVSYYGMIPLVIYKEDPTVLTAIVNLTAQNAASKIKLANIIKEARIFLNHVEIKLKEKENREGVESEEAREVYTRLSDNIVALESAFSLFNYSTAISDKEVKVNALVNGTIKDLVDANKVQEAIASCILTDKFDRQTEVSYVSTLSGRYGSFLKVSSNIDRIVDAYDEYINDKDLDVSKDSSLKLVDSLLKYSKTSYEYTKDELDLLKELDFPKTLAGLEKYLKSDVTPVLKELSGKTKSSRSIMEENYKQTELSNFNKLKGYYATFTRKKLIGEMNNQLGMSAVCMYF